MTFDLHFYRRKNVPEPRVEELREYFRGNQNFLVRDFKLKPRQESGAMKGVLSLDIKQVYQIDYENPTTRVYFQMLYVIPVSSGELPSFTGLDLTGLGAHVNLSRPTYFALESFPLVVETADKFGLLTFDNQMGSKHKEPFKADAPTLIESWTEANSWAVGNFRKHGYDARYFPKERLDYNWNFERQAGILQRRLGDDVYVPTRIFFAERQGVLGTFVTWTNYIPMVFPHVDWVFVGQLEGAKDFRFQGFARLDDILPVLDDHLRKVSEPVPHYLLSQELRIESRKKLDDFPFGEMKEIKALPLNANFVDVAPS